MTKLKDEIKSRLDFRAFYGKVLHSSLKQGSGRQGQAVCPFHADTNPSLSVNLETGLFKCFGCDASGDVFTFVQKFYRVDFKGALEVLGREVGLDPSSFRKKAGKKKPKTKGLTLVELSEAKKLPIEFLRNLGLREKLNQGIPEVWFPYFDEHQNLVAVRRRLALSGSGNDKFRWRKGDELIPYGLWKLGEIHSCGWVLLLEGESDLATARFYKLPSISIPGKSTWKPEWARYFEGLRVYLWMEPDAPELPAKIARDLPDLLVIRCAEFKDLSEAHISLSRSS